MCPSLKIVMGVIVNLLISPSVLCSTSAWFLQRKERVERSGETIVTRRASVDTLFIVKTIIHKFSKKANQNKK